MNDALGDRMKDYEMAEAGRKLLPLIPVIARIDGRSFSKFTQGLARPFDERLSRAMIETTIHLVRETNACCGYTQSDEITMAWHHPDRRNKIFFDGRTQKLNSVLAGMASTVFYSLILNSLPPEYAAKHPHFDCRTWNVPTAEEGANVFLWRELDATKNSISMAAQEHYDYKELLHKNGSEKQEMLFQKGINWNDYPAFFKRGSFIQRCTTKSKFTAKEINDLPPKHAARTNPDLEVERSEYMIIDMPPFGKVVNRADVIFEGAKPETL